MTDEALGSVLIDGSEPQPAHKLYSLGSIGLATFLGTWLAGAVLISRNYSRLGKRRASRISILLGVLSIVPILLTGFFIDYPEQYDAFLPAVLQGIQLGVISMIAHRLQGEAFSAHEEKGGQFYSNWRAAGVALLLAPVAVVLFLVGGVTLSTLLQPQDIEIRFDAPLVVKEGEPFEIQLHVQNKGDTQVTLVAIDISQEYLRGIEIESFDPPFSASEVYPFGDFTFVSHYYDLPIHAGQEIEIILQAHGEVQGNYYEFFSFCIDSAMTCLDYQVLTTVQ
ncbi:MAG: hypothetical protein V3T19_08290 [Acidiferrobacterales bacterium]